MNERQLKWLEEAEEVATPVVEAIQFQAFDFDQSVKEEGIIWTAYWSEDGQYREWLREREEGY